ncbi:HAMP domain-containing protein [Candidatus Halobeggiatoa sp. HSG11]|nr:HAMP domain-containing protein [Candidatus Halobeggiatoa sp. HSG11]
MMKLIKPAILLMDNLKYPQKIALMAGIVLIPLTFLLFFLISEMNIRIDFAKKERIGISYNQQVMKILQNIQQHRGMASAFHGGDLSFKDKMVNKQKDIEQNIKDIEKIDEIYTLFLNTSHQWDDLKKDWKKLQKEVLQINARESFQRHSKLNNKIRTLITHVADTSNLTLDPDIDSYYLADTLSTKLPTLTEYIGQVRALGVAVAASRKLSVQESSHIPILFGLTKTTMEQINYNLQKVYAEYPKFKNKLYEYEQENYLILNKLLTTINNEIIFTEHISISSEEFFQLCTETINKQFYLYHSIAPLLDEVLLKRINKFNQKKVFVITTAVMLFVILFYLFLGSYFSITNAINNLLNSSTEIASGNLKIRANVTTNDELSQIAGSFNNMIIALDRYISVEKELSMISSQFVEEKGADLDHILEILGKLIKVNRSYIFLLEENGQFMSNTHEWCDHETKLQKDNLQALKISDFQHFFDKIIDNGVYAINDVDEISDAEFKKHLQGQAIHSLICVPILSKTTNIIGFIGFDDTINKRYWTNNDIRILKMVSELLSNDFARKKAEKLVIQRQQEIVEMNVSLGDRIKKEVEKSREKDLIMMHQARLAGMGEMIGNIAHQWRQPINTIQILLFNIKSAFEDDELDLETLDGFIDRGSNIIKKMSSTIDDFRNFFNPNRKKNQFDVNEKIEETLSLMSASLKYHNVNIKFSYENGIIVNGFANELSQVLINIINNAKDARLSHKK